MQILKTMAMTCALAAALLGAENPFLGTWTLNVEKSTFAPGKELKSFKVIFKSEGHQIRRIAEGIDGQGKPMNEGGPDGDLMIWDGKEHRVSKEGEPEVVISAGPLVGRSVDVTVRIQGKVISRDHAVVSEDGQTTTTTQLQPDEKGDLVKSVLVFEKQ